ncbi:MAG: hypothetical protein JO045_04965, partial [Mycobacterium sp.]|nr:hypothetical protein [Mycobacterium sp.]
DLMPREMIDSYAVVKKAAAIVNHVQKRLADEAFGLIVQSCDEVLAGQHRDMFPLHVWMTGSGTQFNMNVNEVISNRCCQLAGTPLGSKTPLHPNDHVNMSQSSNDLFPSAMYIAAAVGVKQRLLPAVQMMHDAIATKAKQWDDIIKIGRTHSGLLATTVTRRPLPPAHMTKVSTYQCSTRALRVLTAPPTWRHSFAAMSTGRGTRSWPDGRRCHRGLYQPRRLRPHRQTHRHGRDVLKGHPT